MLCCDGLFACVRFFYFGLILYGWSVGSGSVPPCVSVLFCVRRSGRGGGLVHCRRVSGVEVSVSVYVCAWYRMEPPHQAGTGCEWARCSTSTFTQRSEPTLPQRKAAKTHTHTDASSRANKKNTQLECTFRAESRGTCARSLTSREEDGWRTRARARVALVRALADDMFHVCCMCTQRRTGGVCSRGGMVGFRGAAAGIGGVCHIMWRIKGLFVFLRECAGGWGWGAYAVHTAPQLA